MKQIKLDVTHLAPAFVITVIVFLGMPFSPTYDAAYMQMAMEGQTPGSIIHGTVGAFLIMWGAGAMFLQAVDIIYDHLTPSETAELTEWEGSEE